MSGGKQTTSSGPPKWAVPYFQSHLNNAQSVASRPYQGYGGQTVAQLNPYQTAGMGMQARRGMQGSPLNAAAGGELQKTLGGGYLNSNPYMDQMVDQASKDVNRNFDMVSARSGSFGNSGVEESRTRALADASLGLRGQDYAAERGRMQGAVGMAPQIANQDYVDASAVQDAGAGFQRQQQANLSDQYSRFTEQRDYPERQLGVMAQALGLNYGNTSTSKQSSNPLNTALGGAAVLGGK